MNSFKLLFVFVIFSQFSDQGTASFADYSGDYADQGIIERIPDYSSDNAGYSGDHSDYSGDYADNSGAAADQTCSKAKFSLKNNFW